jgi:predicted AlkP superfamily phosphohydrolase/phosphomutase
MKLLKGLRGKRGGKRRVVVVGIDGVPYTYVQRLFAQGELPNLRAIVDEGAMAQMDTSVPNVSSVAWASFMSGQNPGRHGIYGFVDRQPGSLKTYVPTSKNLRSPTLWEVLGEAGKRVFSINVPGTYPSRPANGTVIGCFLSPNVEKAAPNPEVAAELKRLGYHVDADPWRARQDKGAFLSHLDEVFERRMATVRHFWQQEPWDFFMAHIMETDRLHHFFWEEMEDGHPTYAPAFLDFYRRLDAELGEMRGWLDDDTTLVVLSDHGFCSIRQEVHVNTWLKEQGYLRFTTDEPKGLEAMAPDSMAYSLDPGRLFVNLKGREPEGRIEPGAEYDRVRDELADTAAAMTDPDNGAPMVKRVYRREELYSGPYADLGADLVLDMHDGYDPKGAFGRPSVLYKGESLTGMHTTPDALVYVAGAPAIEGRPHIADVAPTVCDLLGVPSPEHMDGRSLVPA